MNDFFLIAILVLIFLVIFQISKASEYVSILKGEEKARKQNNRINGFLMIAFLIAGLVGYGGVISFIILKLYFHRDQHLKRGKY